MKQRIIVRGEQQYISPEVDNFDVNIEQGFALSTTGGIITDLEEKSYGEY